MFENKQKHESYGMLQFCRSSGGASPPLYAEGKLEQFKVTEEQVKNFASDFNEKYHKKPCSDEK